MATDGGNGNSGDVGVTPPPLPPVTGTLYAFGGTGSPAQDGAEPKGTLTAVTVNGATVLYGRTAIGGTNGCGTIFSINPDGSNYNVQYRYGGSDGCDPRHDAMILNPNDGKLYGTTQGVNQTIATPPPPNTYGNWGQIFFVHPGHVDSHAHKFGAYVRQPVADRPRPSTGRSSTARSPSTR